MSCSAVQLKTIIKTLPSKLSLLRVDVADGDEDLEEMALITSLIDFPSLKRLRCFEFLCYFYSRENVFKISGGPALIEVLEGRGVKIVYGNSYE